MSSIEPAVDVMKEPLAGAVGLELACLLLMDPVRVFGCARPPTERASSKLGLARTATPAGVRAGRHRTSTGLPGPVPGACRRWSPESVDLASLPRPGDTPINDSLHLGLDDPEPSGLGVGDTLAAIAYGAPVSASGGYPPDLYAPDRATLRRARQLLGASSSRQERAGTLRVAPVPMVTSRRVVWTAGDRGMAAAVHPLFVALDLAQDPDRGR